MGNNEEDEKEALRELLEGWNVSREQLSEIKIQVRHRLLTEREPQSNQSAGLRPNPARADVHLGKIKYL